MGRALGAYRENCYRDWLTSWALWVPGHAVTYFVMPLHLRIPWVATASAGYVCVLSYTRGSQR